jgi:hypothetical protein
MDIAGQAQPLTLDLEQQFQEVKGTARIGNRTRGIASPKLDGAAFEFVLEALPAKRGERQIFRARVVGETMDGEMIEGAGPMGRRSKWKAARIQPAAEALAQ